MAKKKMSLDYKILWILVIILVICFIIIGIVFYKYFYGGTNKSVYGDRLVDIENYPLDTDKLLSDLKEVYSSEKSIGDVSVDLKGRVLYINIEFSSIVKEATAKTLATKSLDCVGEENLTYYEVQFILNYTGEEETSVFPLFGSKGVNSSKVVW